MTIDNIQSKFKDVVERCRSAHNPIAGIFWLANQKIQAVSDLSIFRDAMYSLLDMTPKRTDDWLRLHKIEDIERQSNWQLGLPAFVFNTSPLKIETYVRRDSLATHIVPEAFSVAGYFRFKKMTEWSRLYLEVIAEKMPNGLLPGFKKRASFSVSEAEIPCRGLYDPLHQWLPAFRQKRAANVGPQVYDLFDQAVFTMNETEFDQSCSLLEHHADALPAQKAHYLGRQAAHAHDAATHGMAALCQSKTDASQDEGDRLHAEYLFMSRRMLTFALAAGAHLTQSEWSGPQGNGRPFKVKEGDFNELVYPLLEAAGSLSDEQIAATLKRMANEGHDVVIQHRSDASNCLRRDAHLPLHHFTILGYTQSVLALLDAGADTKAVLHTRKGVQSLAQSAAKNPLTKEITMGMMHAFEARRKAQSVLNEMGLDSTPESAPRSLSIKAP